MLCLLYFPCAYAASGPGFININGKGLVIAGEEVVYTWNYSSVARSIRSVEGKIGNTTIFSLSKPSTKGEITFVAPIEMTGTLTIRIQYINNSGTLPSHVMCLYEPTHILNIPADTVRIESEALKGLESVEAIRLPGNLTNIADDAIDQGVLIYAPASSKAAQWAKGHGFIVVEGDIWLLFFGALGYYLGYYSKEKIRI